MKLTKLCTAVLISWLFSLHAYAVPPRQDLLGEASVEEAGMRTVFLTDSLNSISVTEGEHVKFIANGTSFSWVFDTGSTVSVFDLNLIAPPGLLTHPIYAYIAQDPKFIGS